LLQENAGSISVPVSLSKASSQVVTVHWTTQDGTAKAGTNYIANGGMVTFPPGVTSRTVSVTMLNNKYTADQGKTFNVVLSSPIGATLYGNTQSTVSMIESGDNPIQINTPIPTVYPTSGPAPSTNYNKWIGPTEGADPSPHLISQDSYNKTLAALFGSDTRNSTLDSFNGMELIGGLTWPYNGIGPVVIMIIGVIIGIVMYIKNDGDMLLPCFILIGTGVLSAGTGILFQVPIEMVLFAGFACILGIGGLVYIAIMGRD
jgi:hypothetical protein